MYFFYVNHFQTGLIIFLLQPSTILNTRLAYNSLIIILFTRVIFIVYQFITFIDVLL